MGEHSYGNPKVLCWSDNDSYKIGKFCCFADKITIFTGGNHRVDWVTTYPLRSKFNLPGADSDGHPASKGETVICNDVWVGRGAVIMSGVTVGDGSVIGAYSVVSKNIPPYAIVAGNPARLIRYRFENYQIKALLRIKWWDWELDKILKAVSFLCDDQINTFIKKFDKNPEENEKSRNPHISG
ncbi:MAG TPA: CatB-related O-acetyltransferase [Desulfobacteraceae bacterium]|nr:MAG: antibiotic acetyltransferase [Deltaproteobacteria bacterium]HDL07913.1 CatB-related O-acetyltransferase [Desulfobacteraceae bacterium]